MFSVSPLQIDLSSSEECKLLIEFNPSVSWCLLIRSHTLDLFTVLYRVSHGEDLSCQQLCHSVNSSRYPLFQWTAHPISHHIKPYLSFLSYGTSVLSYSILSYPLVSIISFIFQLYPILSYPVLFSRNFLSWSLWKCAREASDEREFSWQFFAILESITRTLKNEHRWRKDRDSIGYDMIG